MPVPRRDDPLGDLPADVLACITQHLAPADKIRLGACSKTLRARSADWFHDTPIAVDGTVRNPSAAWLRRVRAPVHVRMAEWGCIDGKVSAANVLRRMRGVNVVDVDIRGRVRHVPSALACLTNTTSLRLTVVKKGFEHVACLRRLQSLAAPIGEVHPLTTALTALTRLRVTAGPFGAHMDTNLSRLAGLPRLVHLEIGPLVLTTVAGFSRLTGLTHLNLQGNMLGQRGWEDVACLPRLRVLKGATCQLAEVPPALSRMTGLTALDLSGNHAVTNWEPVRHLTGLRHLSAWPRADEVPPAFRDLTCLTFLSTSHAVTGWDRMDRLRNLEKLVLLSSPAVQVHLPGVLSLMTALTSLVTSHNCVEGGWQHLPALRELNASHCHVRSLVPHLPSMTALTRLDLTGVHLPPTWDQARLPPRLARLHIGWCGLHAVPEAVAQCGTLTALDLSTNDFSYDAAWHRLAPLTRLAELQLHQCNVAFVPPQLSLLTALTHLSLDRNPIPDGRHGGWRHLRHLRRLRQLSIGHKPMPAELSGMRAVLHPPSLAHAQPSVQPLS